jgi:hypothetical protein
MPPPEGSGAAPPSPESAGTPASDELRRHAQLPLWRRLLPVVLATVLVATVLARIDWPSFWAQLLRLNYPAFVGFMVAFLVTLLAADTLATQYVYRRTLGPVAFGHLFLMRGASYLPSSLNHHLGQAWLTYFVATVYGVRLGRVAGATLLVYATWGGCVLGLGSVGMLAAGLPMGWLAVPLGAGVAYLVLLWIRPRRLAANRVLGPLMEAGVSGHLAAMVMRLPHVAVLFLGTWLPFHFFGIAIPLAEALTYVPIIMVAVTLPITPQGFGTRDVLAATFFASRVVDAASPEQCLAVVAAATMTQGVVITLIGLAIGVVLMPRALRFRQSGPNLKRS